ETAARVSRAPGPLAPALEPRLPSLLLRPARLARRHVDAVGGAVLAGPGADELAVPAWPGRHPAVRAVALLLVLRGRHGRPAAEAARARRQPVDHVRAGAAPRPACSSWARSVTARRPA